MPGAPDASDQVGVAGLGIDQTMEPTTAARWLAPDLGRRHDPDGR
ncbi:MAG TPA: hypothetical protein VFQ68_38845 [Streptosporangiaceae bacterium]|nr:hypothetical protein [Streptosporangiaceae bacterium]